MQGLGFSLIILCINYPQFAFLIPIWVCIYIFGYSIGLGGTINTFLSEFVPAMAIGIGVFIQGLTCTLIVKFIPILLEM